MLIDISLYRSIPILLPMVLGIISLPFSPFSPFGSDQSGGGEVNLYNLINHLPKNWAINLYTVKTHRRVRTRTNINLVLIDLNLKPNTWIDKNIAAKRVIRQMTRITDVIMKKRNDLIYSQYWISGLLSSYLKQKFQIPFVHSFLTLGKTKKTVSSEINAHLDFRLFQEEKIVHLADYLIANTKVEKQDLIKLYQADPTKIAVIPPGICPDVFHPFPKKTALAKLDLSPKFRYLLFVGRMDPIKGIPVLIESMSKLTERFTNLKLIITGGAKDSNYFKKVKELVYNKNLRKFILLKEAQPHHLLPYFYAAAEITVIPSYHETFGLVALESISCGTPVIASNVGGLKTFIMHGKNGLLFTKGDVNDLTKKIVYLLESEKERKKIARNGVKTSQSYTWDKIIKKYLQLYQSLPKKL